VIGLEIAIGALGAGYVALPVVWAIDSRHRRATAAQLQLAGAKYRRAAVCGQVPGTAAALPAGMTARPPVAGSARAAAAAGGNGGGPERVFDPAAKPQPRDQFGHPVSKQRLAELGVTASGHGDKGGAG